MTTPVTGTLSRGVGNLGERRPTPGGGANADNRCWGRETCSAFVSGSFLSTQMSSSGLLSQTWGVGFNAAGFGVRSLGIGFGIIDFATPDPVDVSMSS